MNKFVVVFLTFLLFACNPVQMFEEMSEKQAKFNEISLKKLGVEAQVGWNITNGQLSNVSVFYPQGTLGDLKVKDLEKTTIGIVKEVFEQTPNVVTFGFQVVENQ